MPTARPTIADIAQAAGVGVATVDRVLNDRAPVRKETRDRVIMAARELGFVRRKPRPLVLEEEVATSAEVEVAPQRLAFMLQRRNPAFYQEVTQALLRIAGRMPEVAGPPEIVFSDGMHPREVAATLLQLGQTHDAIAIVAADHPLISQAIDQLQAQGVACFALMSELSAQQRAGYVGLDNRKVGRTAAWAIASLSRRPGKVGILMGHHRLLCQELCEIGFRSYFREHAADFVVLDPVLSLENEQRAYRATRDMLQAHPDLVGLYIDSGAVEGVFRALEEVRDSQQRVSVCHEFVAATRTALMNNVIQLVLAHPLEQIAREILTLMIAHLEHPGHEAPLQRIVPFEILTPENI